MHQRGNGIGWFIFGTGIGMLFATAAVILAAELTRRRYFRDPVTGELVLEDYDPLEGVAETLQTGLSMLAGAATGVTETFTPGLRERDPLRAGSRRASPAVAATPGIPVKTTSNDLSSCPLSIAADGSDLVPEAVTCSHA